MDSMVNVDGCWWLEKGDFMGSSRIFLYPLFDLYNGDLMTMGG